MKLFAFILLVTLVVGDGFYQPFSSALTSPWQQASSSVYLPFLPNRPVYYYYHHPNNRPNNWAQYFQDHFYNPIALTDPTSNMPYYNDKKYSPQGIFSGQQRSTPTKNDYAADEFVEPKVSFSRQRFPYWNQKFFLLDNEAHTVQALRPLHLLELLSSMQQLNQMKPSAPLTRPIFARQTVKMTATEIVKVTSTKICVPSKYFADSINPIICPIYNSYNRTRRSIDLDGDFLENIVSPTTVNQEDLVMPTILIGDHWRSPVYEIESTKNENVDDRLELNYYGLPSMTNRKDRAMFNRVPSTSMVTVTMNEMHYVTKAIDPVSSVTGQPGALICVPPGLVMCA